VDEVVKVTPIETERLVLRLPEITDARDIFANYAADPEVTRYLTWAPHQSVEETEGFLRMSEEHRSAGTDFVWAITEAGSVIGMVGLHMQRFGGMMMGFVLARSRWGKGYMSEAAAAVMAHALRDADVHRVWAVCDLENKASARVLEKIGMSFEGTLRAFSPRPGQPPGDVLSYALVKAQSFSSSA
jgi:ribosomal-protein-alanine N-acetyltransferase